MGIGGGGNRDGGQYLIAPLKLLQKGIVLGRILG